jgi:rsbT co-antagonist protein RsbR
MATTLNHKTSNLGSIIAQHQDAILNGWLRDMVGSTRRSDLIKEAELQGQCRRFLSLLAQATTQSTNTQSAAFDGLREMLAETSRARAIQGFTPRETATFILSIKQPLFTAIRETLIKDPVAMADEMWLATEIIDGLGLWEGILALPLIGTLDSARTQVVMESLLEAIVQTNSKVAIIDITGVPTVDTVVAQHLLKTVTAARLMGADCIISGVRPQIAQTIVHLGINLLDITTKATLSDAFSLAIARSGFKFVRPQKKESVEP